MSEIQVLSLFAVCENMAFELYPFLLYIEDRMLHASNMRLLKGAIKIAVDFPLSTGFSVCPFF